MQLDLPFFRSLFHRAEPPRQASQPGHVEFVRTRRARRYILRVRPDGTLRVTIPRGGSKAEGMHFVGQHLEWIAKQRAKVRAPQVPVRWTDGSTVLIDGVLTAIAVERAGDSFVARYGGRSVTVSDPDDVRAAIEKDLRVLAAERLVPRLRALASEFQLTFTKVTIRNQRSRWGSCSRVGAIALNFRLVQMPRAVSDYVLIHELMHLQQQNHGPSFWRLVERACPTFRESERWLRTEGRLLF